MASTEPVAPVTREGLERLLRVLAQKNGSDLYLSAAAQPVVRIHGLCVPASSKPLAASDPLHMLSILIGETRAQSLRAPEELECVATLPELGRFRVNAFFQRGAMALAVRHLPLTTPSFDSHPLAPALRTLALAKSGLLLLSGQPGAGKTSTVACLLDHRNSQTSGHILTLEQTIEYPLTSKKSVLNQREIGVDTATWQSAFEGVSKQACDVVWMGAIHDTLSARAALQLAQSGVLCVATIDAPTMGQALSQMIHYFPSSDRAYAKSQLGDYLRALVLQKLRRTQQGPRVAVCEILTGAQTISEVLARGEFRDLDHADLSNFPACISFTQDIARLQAQGLVFDNEETEAAVSLGNTVAPSWGASRFGEGMESGFSFTQTAPSTAHQPITLSLKS